MGRWVSLATDREADLSAGQTDRGTGIGVARESMGQICRWACVIICCPGYSGGTQVLSPMLIRIHLLLRCSYGVVEFVCSRRGRRRRRRRRRRLSPTM
jgi:hypothetical protein